MAYIALADFRTATLAEYCSGLTLSTTEAADPAITAAVVRLTQRFNEWTNDAFESESLTLELDGSGYSRLILPKRCTAVATVKIRDADAVLGAAESADAYRLHSSLYSTGSKRQGEFDWLDLVPEGDGLSNVTGSAYVWPCGPQTIQVVGTFGWTTTPGDVKRAVALLTYDHFKPIAADLRLSSRWQTQEVSYDRAVTTPSGIPEVDGIVARYLRESGLGV